MIKIYHAPMTRSLRVIWLCEELSLPYEVEKISFDPSFRFSDEWLARNPTGKVPVMEDGDLMIFETGAMVQYLLDRYGAGRLQPVPGTPEHAEYLQWSWFGEATFSRPVGEIVNHRRNFDPEIPEVVAEMQKRALQCIDAIDQRIAGKEFLAGDFTAADIMVGYTFFLADLLLPFDDHLEARRYWQSLKSRPAAQKTFSENF